VDDLRDVYSMYGKSTKRDSDEVTGMLGLGCKAGLTYANAFGVTSVKNGVKVTATVTKDEDGVGTIRILDTRATDERNGVLISIPVKPHDVSSFAAEAQVFFQYWRNGEVRVDGELPEGVNTDNAIWLDDDILVSQQAGQSRIVMGGVPYPVTLPHFPHSVTAWVPMGAVNFTPSREALHMTTRTEETIKELIAYCSERLPKRLEQEMQSLSTPFERIELANKWAFSHIARSHPMWQPFQKYRIVLSRVAWYWNGGRARKVEGTVSPTQFVGNGGNYIKIITDFPVKILNAAHRERLNSFGAYRCYVLPTGTDTSLLEGRPEVYTWEQVVEATPKPKSEVTKARTKTVYAVLHKGRVLHKEELDPADGPILYCSKQEYTRSDQFPEAQIVVLYAHQVDRFRRLHPTAKRVESHFRDESAKAAKALTKDDRVWMGITWGNTLMHLHKSLSDIKDPDLRRLVKIHAAGMSPRVRRLKALYADSQARIDPLQQTVSDRYPLIEKVGRYGETEDLILYANAKYAHLKEQS
jgi:hypothetical protein